MLLVDIFVSGCLTVTTVLHMHLKYEMYRPTKIVYYLQEEVRNTRDDQTNCLEILMSVDRNESLSRMI
jgi:hypothetical protein